MLPRLKQDPNRKRGERMRWEVTIIKVDKATYKVTRRIPDLSVSETKVFDSKKAAMQQFEDWTYETLG